MKLILILVISIYFVSLKKKLFIQLKLIKICILIPKISHRNFIYAKNDLSNKLRLDDLNADVLLEILDEFEFENLVKLADVNHNFRRLNQYYMIHKYRLHEKTIQIKINHYRSKIKFSDDGSIIIIQNAQLALTLLRNFGHLISNIIFNQYNYSSSKKRMFGEIGPYINKYCDDSLEQLRISFFWDEFIGEWKKPFKNIRILHFSDHINLFDKIKIFNLSEIFPSVRYLNLHPLLYIEPRLFNYHLQYLEHIECSIYPMSKTLFGMNTTFFDLNPQIRSIKILKVDTIEIDDITSFEYSEEFNSKTIHFRNVKRFYISFHFWTRDCPTFIPLEFDQLEEMMLCRRSGGTKQWIEFIGQQQQLKTLIIPYPGLNSQQWMSIIGNATKLEVIKTIYEPNREENGIEQVMTAQTNLTKVILSDMTSRKINMLRMRDVIDSEWQIESTVSYVATFARRKNGKI